MYLKSLTPLLLFHHLCENFSPAHFWPTLIHDPETFAKPICLVLRTKCLSISSFSFAFLALFTQVQAGSPVSGPRSLCTRDISELACGGWDFTTYFSTGPGIFQNKNQQSSFTLPSLEAQTYTWKSNECLSLCPESVILQGCLTLQSTQLLRVLKGHL